MSKVYVNYKREKHEINNDFMLKRPLSYSSAKQFRKSPKHYVHYLEEPFKPTDAMIKGMLVDVLVLTPDKFEAKFKVYQKATGTGSRAINNEQKAQAMKEQKLLITPEDLAIAEKCKEALYAHPMAKQLLDNITKTQVKLSWTDKRNNIPCIGYVDFETVLWDQLFIVDLKTANDGDPEEFNKSAYNLDYPLQIGAYLDGYHKVKYKFPYFVYLVVETKKPFNVTVDFVDNKTIEYSKNEWSGTLKAFRYCLDNEQFDMGYDFRLFGTKEYHSFNLPGFAKPKFGNF